MSTLNVKNIQYPAGTGTINVPSGTKIVSSTSGGIYSPGNVIQTIQNSLNTQQTTTSTSYVSTALTVTITPTNASSKILVTAQITAAYGSGTGGGLAIYRNSSAIFTPSPVDATGPYMVYGNVFSCPILSYLDSPGSTSALTYTIYFRCYNGNVFSFNGGTGATANYGTSTITVQEIGG